MADFYPVQLHISLVIQYCAWLMLARCVAPREEVTTRKSVFKNSDFGPAFIYNKFHFYNKQNNYGIGILNWQHVGGKTCNNSWSVIHSGAWSCNTFSVLWLTSAVPLFSWCMLLPKMFYVPFPCLNRKYQAGRSTLQFSTFLIWSNDVCVWTQHPDYFCVILPYLVHIK